MAIKDIKRDQSIIAAQVAMDYRANSSLREDFSKIFGDVSHLAGSLGHLYAKWLTTKLGDMIAICDEDALVLLEFAEKRALEVEIKKLRQH